MLAVTSCMHFTVCRGLACSQSRVFLPVVRGVFTLLRMPGAFSAG